MEGEDKGRMGYGVFDPVKRQQLMYEQTRLLITHCPTSRRLTSLDRVYFVSVTRVTDSRLHDPYTWLIFEFRGKAISTGNNGLQNTPYPMTPVLVRSQPEAIRKLQISRFDPCSLTNSRIAPNIAPFIPFRVHRNPDL
jgi:hypothetical protein